MERITTKEPLIAVNEPIYRTHTNNRMTQTEIVLDLSFSCCNLLVFHNLLLIYERQQQNIGYMVLYGLSTPLYIYHNLFFVMF